MGTFTEIISRDITGGYSEQIRRLRVAYGLTQEVLAEKLGVSFATVNRWENERTRPSNLAWNQLRQFENSAKALEKIP